MSQYEAIIDLALQNVKITLADQLKQRNCSILLNDPKYQAYSNIQSTNPVVHENKTRACENNNHACESNKICDAIKKNGDKCGCKIKNSNEKFCGRHIPRNKK